MSNSIKYTSVEVGYLEWARETINELKQQNAALVGALEMIANAKGLFSHELSTMAKDALALVEGKNNDN